MTFQTLYDRVSNNELTLQAAYDEINTPTKLKTINFYKNLPSITDKELDDDHLQELLAIVGVLQILYDSKLGSPIDDTTYDILEEELVNLGVPRNNSSVEINDAKKVAGKFTVLRGTLDKVYYLYPDEYRTNKSRKSLDEWLKSTSERYTKKTGKKINFDDVEIVLTAKCDGLSCVLEIDEKGKKKWITRGDTNNNLATDVSHIMRGFDKKYKGKKNTGIKFEVMVAEEDMKEINKYWSERPYKNTRQVAASTLNSAELDYKSKFLTPIPLKEIKGNEELADISEEYLLNFPSLICTFGDRDKIKQFADDHKYVKYKGKHYRTDGVVLTILDKKIQKALGRDNSINKFEVAYKFTEESAYTKVKDVEFYVSEFGYITPVLVVNDVILKGNTINHISLSNIERFRELNLRYGDTVKVLYDIIPYVIKDKSCKSSNHHKIEFIEECPMCHSKLDLSGIQVQCKNPKCPSRKVGKVANYCANLKIKNLGWKTLYTLYSAGLLNHGIVSLYKIKKNADKIIDLDGFGRLRLNRIIAEIDAKRVLYDYEFFGSLGIEGLSVKSFKTIFERFPLNQFLEFFNKKNFEEMKIFLVDIPGISINKATAITSYLEQPENSKMISKLMKILVLRPSYGNVSKGRLVFTGIRPSKEIENYLTNNGWEVSDSWNNKAKYLIVPSLSYSSRKVEKAQKVGVPIINVDGNVTLGKLRKAIKNL